VLNDLGLALPDLEPTVATSISDDGMVITGFGASVFRTPARRLIGASSIYFEYIARSTCPRDWLRAVHATGSGLSPRLAQGKPM
jgi:hypothetical protein